MDSPLTTSLGTPERGKYYSYSRRLDLRRAAANLSVGLLASLLLGYAYGYTVVRSPGTFVSVLALLLFSVAEAVVVYRLFRGTSRSDAAVGYVLATLFGILMLYISWGVFLFGLGRQGPDQALLPLLLDPARLWGEVQVWWSDGRFAVAEDNPLELPAFAISALEALVMVGAANTGLNWAVGIVSPFCERCREWVPVKERVIGIPISGDELAMGPESHVVKALVESDWSPVESAVPVEEVLQPALLLAFGRCVACRGPVIMFVEGHGRDSGNVLHSGYYAQVELPEATVHGLMEIARDRGLLLVKLVTI
ncbi:MAG: hypothetical protein JSU87_06465 [Gemmatimonadota bacterium]|nr:MAG: hypothetical protein JSU87_06465 [Gemmatimonadota bacterium]